ncbi:polysaccharide biosynthesis/export family protein [Amphritea sp. 2_MG-2023]|uniref:polysaccharide biosynthesis/export family protein n=1 Tax=Amphritea TaxID=515417 RepID=UPI001C0787B0|nr:MULTISPECIES: polysaccharide biosynthesis/export family protein [Amphritea]MBU2965220.1 polysaccharide export protein [Amphritea atlantica]MDO6419711.1 polysaccharide biosynthesis/export family protein [Amphritea sp. 2_MG-2023]
MLHLKNYLKLSVRVILTILLATSIPSYASEDAQFSDYQLGSGDRVKITVFGEPELSIETRLSDAGTISYPFLGELEVLDLTTSQLSNKVAEGLADGYLLNPNVNVTVLEYREFFINGEVKKPGSYPFQPGLTLQKAVAIAGGFTERASKSKIFIQKDGSDEDPIMVDLSQQVSPGDIITIDQSFF